jgi:hypothetical protein
VGLEISTIGHRMEKRPEGSIAAAKVKIIKLSLWDMNCYHLIENPEKKNQVTL